MVKLKIYFLSLIFLLNLVSCVNKEDKIKVDRDPIDIAKSIVSIQIKYNILKSFNSNNLVKKINEVMNDNSPPKPYYDYLFNNRYINDNVRIKKLDIDEYWSDKFIIYVASFSASYEKYILGINTYNDFYLLKGFDVCNFNSLIFQNIDSITDILIADKIIDLFFETVIYDDFSKRIIVDSSNITTYLNDYNMINVPHIEIKNDHFFISKYLLEPDIKWCTKYNFELDKDSIISYTVDTLLKGETKIYQ